MHDDLQKFAENLLDQAPGVVVRWRLMRDLLGIPTRFPEVDNELRALDQSRWVSELAQEQWEDGSWGAFHSRNTKRKQRILTTEFGVARALALGLDTSHPILKRAEVYLLRVLCGEIPFPDHNEVNDRWPTGVRLFVASTLGLVRPAHPILDPDRALWLEIARRTFQSGVYNEADEIRAHKELTGASIKGTYLILNGKYQLNLLGSISGMLPLDLEQVLLRWVWQNPNGIGYLSVPLNRHPEDRPAVIDRWLASLELLAQRFPSRVSVARPAIDWLWSRRDTDGYWDFGSLPRESTCLPFSDSWRDRRTRRLDWTVRVLTLLNRAGK